MSGTLRLIYIILLPSILCSCRKGTPSLFKEHKSIKTGINFSNDLKNTPELNILAYLYYYNGAGLASGDFNNDGLEDLYFIANQQSNKLYINKGSFKFKDITHGDLIDQEGWSTGVSTVDINNDGLLDIYICKVGNYKGITGKNILLVNKGNDNDGNPQFKEEASKYNIDISSFSTQAAFLDYDLDGDLDMFLLNHSVHPNRAYGRGSLRTQLDSLSGDRLFRNDNGNFVDVSVESRIYQGKIGYGLGVAVSDLNNDGYPDLYISNDFFENDYLYINQSNGTFQEIITNDEKKLGHTSHFSMGNDIADFNNDGLTDIISLDMLPENIETYKASGTEYAFQNYRQYLMNGYAPQYMQNMLQLNLGNGNFSEIAFAAGVAATEWSWAPLFADFNNDGYKDLYITNGIKGATNDMDFISFIANENIQKRINQGMSKEDMVLIDELPEKKVKNFMFSNNGDLTFKNVSKNWLNNKSSFSNGAVYVDLDSDGDLDLVTNNINEKATVLENTSELNVAENAFLKINFKGSKCNPFGIGAKVKLYVDSLSILHENYTTRGYLSSVSPNLTVGIGKVPKVDSLLVIWPEGNYQVLKNLNVNTTISLREKSAKGNFYNIKDSLKFNTKPFLKNKKIDLPYKHQDNSFVEFTRDPLVPYMNTYQGGDISVADINDDGLEDVFLSGAKTKASQLFVQNDNGSFSLINEEVFKKDAMSEDIKHCFFDVDGDADKDLIVVSGGNEFKKGKPLQPRLYINNAGKFTKKEDAFYGIEVNASCIKSNDIDNDGDIDIFIGSNSLPHKFGKTPINYFFKNDGQGNFESTEMNDLGLVQDAVFIDINNDNKKDLVAVGYWMPVTILLNSKNGFHKVEKLPLTYTNGLWNCVSTEDFDNDGDMDLIVGNWGTNTRLKASKEQPIKLYLNDFDDNGSIDPIITYYHQNKEVFFSTKEELTKQLPFLNKKYLSYTDFAQADFKNVLPKRKVNSALKKEIYTLKTTYFENIGNSKFKAKELPFLAQISSVNAMYIEDFDANGFKDVLLAGNRYDINTQLGRLDASHGQLLMNYNGNFKISHKNSFTIDGPAKAIKKIKINNEEHYLIAINNDSLRVLKKITY